MSDDRAPIFKRAKKQGWQVFHSDHHIGILAPDGERYITPSTPSDWRSKRNLVSWMRRHGFQWNH